MTNVDNVLAERGKRYGDFAIHAVIAQDIQDSFRNSGGWYKLSNVQKQALTVIADKIARILSGDPNYDDNWIDIQGYAKLVQDRLPVPAPAGEIQFRPYEPIMRDAPAKFPPDWERDVDNPVAIPLGAMGIPYGQAIRNDRPGQAYNGF